LLFSDLTVDETSGQVTLRAEFPNPDHLLLPGMYVRARVEQAVNEKTITIPQQAVSRTPDGAVVMVVGPDNKVAARPVKTGNASGNSWIVTDGLKEGDQVIVEGLQKVQPGAPVKPVPWQKAAPAADAAAQPASAPADKNADQPKSK
jgi:membrane fusion protein (multidrug efflux system)